MSEEGWRGLAELVLAIVSPSLPVWGSKVKRGRVLVWALPGPQDDSDPDYRMAASHGACPLVLKDDRCPPPPPFPPHMVSLCV